MVNIVSAGPAPEPFAGYVVQLDRSPAIAGGFVHIGVTVPGFPLRRITLRGPSVSYQLQIDKHNPDITGEIDGLVQDIRECGDAVPTLAFEVLDDY